MKRIFLTLIICIGLLSSLTIGWSAEISDSGNFVRSSSPDVQKQVFENMFGLAYEPEHPNYSLAEQVEGPGVYTGWNQNGTQFELEVILLGDIELAKIGLPMAYLQEAVAADLHFGSAVARISSGGVEMAVTGLVVSANLPIDGFQSRFMVTSIADPASALFNPADLTIDNSPELPAPDFSSRRGGGTAVGPPAPINNCEAECKRILDEAIAKATKIKEDEIKRAEVDRDTDRARALQTYTNSVNEANDSLAYESAAVTAAWISATAACTITPTAWIIGFFTGGVSVGVCVSVAAAVYVAAMTHLLIDNDNTIKSLVREYEDKLRLIQRLYESAIRAAELAFKLAKLSAERAYEKCMELCAN